MLLFDWGTDSATWLSYVLISTWWKHFGKLCYPAVLQSLGKILAVPGRVTKCHSKSSPAVNRLKTY